MGVFSTTRRRFGLVSAICGASACGFSTLDGLSGGWPDASTNSWKPDVDAARDDASEAGGWSSDDAFEVATSDAATDGAPGCEGGCPGNGYCADSECAYPSCIARLLSMPKSPSGVYAIDPDGAGGAPPFRAFCEMVLDGGGWTLVLKVNGTLSAFGHDAPLWENADVLSPDSPDLDRTEAKLASFATIPFNYLRLGMVQNGATHWLILPLAAESLHALMSSGYHTTNVGRAAWERLPSRGSLQLSCNREGINVDTPQAKARIGIVANNQGDCSTCNSVIGFGALGNTVGDLACGNVAASSTDNGDRSDALFGYVMVH